MSETFFIMFESTNATLEQAKEVLETAKFKMSESDGELICSQFASQEFKIHFATEAFVQEEATEITEGSEHEAAIKLCDARFEVSIPDLDEVICLLIGMATYFHPKPKYSLFYVLFKH